MQRVKSVANTAGALGSPDLEASQGGASTQVTAAGQDPSAARPAARALTEREAASSQALPAPPVLCFDISDADDPLEAGQHSMAARFGQLKVTGSCCLLHKISIQDRLGGMDGVGACSAHPC